MSTVSDTFRPDDFAPVEIWAGVEGNFGLAVACLPALRSLFVNILNGSWSGSRATRDEGPTVGKARKIFSKHLDKALGRRDDDSDGDKKTLIPLGNIAVSKTTEVESERRLSSDMESPRAKGSLYHPAF